MKMSYHFQKLYFEEKDEILLQNQGKIPSARDTLVPPPPTQHNTLTASPEPVARISAVTNETFFPQDQLTGHSTPQSSRICNN